MIRVMCVMLALCAPVGAVAGPGCPWDRVESVSASTGLLTVNGRLYGVRGVVARARMEAMLSSCGEDEALVRFRRWRHHRRTANWTAGIGLAVFPLLAVIGVPVSIWSGAREKEAMVAALLDERR